MNRIAASIKPTRLTPEALADTPGPDPTRPWIPQELVPLHGSASDTTLTPAQRLRYNHYYALFVAEQFIWFERQLVLRPLEILLRGRVQPLELRPLLESFVHDEIAHNAALWALLRRAAPALYPQARHALFRPPLSVRAWMLFATAFPRRLPGWVMFINVLEEHTLLTGRRYQKSTDCDPLFIRAHVLHAQDEARHCRIGTLLCDTWIAPLRPLARAASAYLLRTLFLSYYDTAWGHDRPVDYLIRDFPELAPRRSHLIAAVVDGRDRAFCRHLFSVESSPGTARLARRYPMLARAIASVAGA
ncbi:MAG: diiron oxygenase [Nevskiales bacterium]|nr:diiron oxygenase [Nevskiales bacterium]